MQSDRNATFEEVDEYMQNLGFRKEWINTNYNDFYWVSADGRYQVTDLKPNNVIKTGPNVEDYAVIDADIRLYDRTQGIDFNYEEAVGLSNRELNSQYAEYYKRPDFLIQDDVDDADEDRVDAGHSEFDREDLNYSDNSVSYNPSAMFTDEEWDDIFDEMLEMSPLMANAVNRGFFSRQELKQMFSEPDETNQTILEEIRRGLDEGSIKPMTIDENKEDIPLCS